MRAFSELKINQYRGIKNLTLNGLGDINIFVGDNNVGKTSILEAICCFRNPDNAYSIIQAIRARSSNPRPSTFDMLISIFPFGQEKQIDIEADIHDEHHHMVLTGDLERRVIKEKLLHQMMIDSSDNDDGVSDDTESRFVEKEVDFFTGSLWHNGSSDQLVLRNDRTNMAVPFSSCHRIAYVPPYLLRTPITREVVEYKKEIISLLKIFDDNITGFDLVRNEDTRTTTEFIHHKKLGVVPLYTFGDGLRRVFLLATSMVLSQNGVLLIDEIEASIHPSVLADIFAWLVKASKRFEVQIFATTHSNEALREITMVSVDDKSMELVAYRIEKFKDEFYTKRFAEDQLNYMINEKGQDIR